MLMIERLLTTDANQAISRNSIHMTYFPQVAH
jgi:hypothetical protein